MPLNKEQAKEQLNALRVSWLQPTLDGLGALPETARRVGRFIADLKPDGEGKLRWQEHERLWKEFVNALSGLTDDDRRAMLAVLFPTLHETVEAAYQLKLVLPYQTGYMRRAFRASNRPDLHGGSRLAWLRGLHDATKEFHQDAHWFARWAPWLSGYYSADHLGVLLAAAIDKGDQQVLEVLRASAFNEDEIGGLGRHVTRGLLCASNREGWDTVLRLLLAAQREEGLRQVILETADEAHPEAFRLVLGTILENDLARFSSVTRALGAWMALPWDSASVKVVNATLERIVQHLDDDDKRAAVLASDDWEPWYEAAWVQAFRSAPDAIQTVTAGLRHEMPEMRYTAAYLGVQLHVPEVYLPLADSLADPDYRVADLAAARFASGASYSEHIPDLFERAEAQMVRWRNDKEHGKPLTWPWSSHKLDRAELCQVMINALDARPATRMLPHFDHMNPGQRADLCKRLAEAGGEADTQVREFILKMVSDRASQVRDAALKAVSKFTIQDSEAEQLESMLQRKTPELRRAMLALLLEREDSSVLVSARRLIASRNEMQRLGGLELLRQLIKAERSVAQARIAAEDFRTTAKKFTRNEEVQLEQLLSTQTREATLADALGLADASTFALPPEVQPRKVLYMSAAAIGIIEGIDKLAQRHARTMVKTDGHGEYAEQPLGNLGRWGFPTPREGSLQEQLVRWPLREVWEEFFSAHSRAVRDADGLELQRACLFTHAVWPYNDEERFFDDHKVRFRGVVNGVLEWLGRLHPLPTAPAFLLDCVENALALHKVADLAVNPDEFAHKFTWDHGFLHAVLEWVRQHQSEHPELWSREQFRRFWELLLRHDVNAGGRRFDSVRLTDVLRAQRHGLVSDTEFAYFLIGGRVHEGEQRYGSVWSLFDALHAVSARRPDPRLNLSPEAMMVVERCRERILEVELVRGDHPSAATRPAIALRYTGGLRTLARVVRALGKSRIRRDSSWGSSSLSRDYVFSQLMRNTWPSDEDTPEAFAKALPVKEIGAERMLEVAMFAPHWARHIERTMKWPGMADAIWWVHAHTKDDNWSVENEVRDAWHAWISERTPLASADLLDGGVDVAWFNQVIDALGRNKFEQVLEVAKLASSGTGHTRAKLFANAMLGNEKRTDLLKRIKDKRHQDAVRALGLLPLAKGKAAEKDVLERYKVIQEFLRTRRQFGSQRQASEKRAAEIGLENLARTAGYPDPQRLEWAMEAKAVADLAKGPVTVKRGEVEVSLSLDEHGNPDVTITKKGKPLKSVPAALKKDPDIAELSERKTDLKRQSSRMRQSLEAAMLRGDEFTGAELRKLFEHPILAPMLGQLVLIGKHTGYPEGQGKALRDHKGERHPIGATEELRIAHAYDLFKSGKWHAWQKDCFAREIIQPFKQVFRELYVLTGAEKSSEHFTRRYSGQQVHPRQALALLGGRGWVSRPEEGVSKTYHREGLTAWVGFLEGFYTPAEVEGLTVENVSFSKRDQWEPMKLKDVPPRVFSEVMRDVDLMVSVAHRGEVDPEASASTIELRTAIARETLALLKIKNVKFDGRYALIKGHYGDYSVHLGSGIVHRMPGGMVCIIPVHAQHRGRIFLPFADDDPKSAEVLSKILMLAKDTEIKDPNILDQLRR